MKYYLVDTENVATRWAQCVKQAESGDTFLLFYSKRVGPVSMRLFGPACLRGIRFDFIECYVGPNAMDFQMSTELGRLIALHPDAEYAIVSRDTGFDTVVRYWQDRGVTVSREEPAVDQMSKPVSQTDSQPATSQTPDPAPGPAENPVADPEQAARNEYKKRLKALGLTDTDLRVATGIIAAAMCQPEKRRRIDAYNRFKRRYGAQDGLARYRAVKDLVADIAANGPFLPSSSVTEPHSELPHDLDEAVSSLSIKLTAKQHEKLSNMFRHAHKIQNGRNIYRKQLKESFGSSEGTRIFEATKSLL